MELVKISDKTSYIKNPTNIGIFKVDLENVFIIDTGNDKEAGRKILKILKENNYQVKGIINTHSNADHIGGNKFIQDRTNSPIYAFGIEASFTSYPILESSFLYGGYPFRELRTKFLLAQESIVTDIKDANIYGLEYFPLKGHYFDMIGIKTPDDVYFIGDALFSEETINKYHLFFIYDVKEYLNTLDFLATLKGKLFIPSHTEAMEDISSLIEINRKKILEIANNILMICKDERTFEDILKNMFDHYNLTLNTEQYVLVGSTIKSYLSYLYDEGKLTYIFKDNKMLWKAYENN